MEIIEVNIPTSQQILQRYLMEVIRCNQELTPTCARDLVAKRLASGWAWVIFFEECEKRVIMGSSTQHATGYVRKAHKKCDFVSVYELDIMVMSVSTITFQWDLLRDRNGIQFSKLSSNVT